ncbi:MAG TPA: hypothetical protein VFA52_02490 [Candidatus Paceibacterota bacterium]|nr:hypothetical protein [Candidatus Paceibacterota bacterium]
MTKRLLIWLIIIIVLLATLLYLMNRGATTFSGLGGEATSTDYSATSSPNPFVPTSTSSASSTTSIGAVSPDTFTVGLNQSVTRSGITATVVEVVEDSRCPVDVNCIWAGTVKVNIKLQQRQLFTTQTAELNKPINMYGWTGELINVAPIKKASAPISPNDYRFTFRISKS